jgi:hypothetical protein
MQVASIAHIVTAAVMYRTPQVVIEYQFDGLPHAELML